MGVAQSTSLDLERRSINTTLYVVSRGTSHVCVLSECKFLRGQLTRQVFMTRSESECMMDNVYFTQEQIWIGNFFQRVDQPFKGIQLHGLGLKGTL